MAAPQVQTLADVMAELNPAYAAQESVIQKRQAGLGQKYDAQRSGIRAERGEGFNAINNQATGRGMSFSGIPMEEQARYLSTKYLPGMQMADYQQNEEDLNMQGQLAQFGTQKFNQAFDTVNRQKSDLNSWNMAEAQREAAAREAELQRQFTASENAKSRSASAAEGAANRAAAAAASARSSAPAGPTNAQLLDSMSQWTNGKKGRDQKLSPSDFKAGYSQWLRSGGPASPAQYTAAMAQYINNSHAKDYRF